MAEQTDGEFQVVLGCVQRPPQVNNLIPIVFVSGSAGLQITVDGMDRLGEDVDPLVTSGDAALCTSQAGLEFGLAHGSRSEEAAGWSEPGKAIPAATSVGAATTDTNRNRRSSFGTLLASSHPPLATAVDRPNIARLRKLRLEAP